MVSSSSNHQRMLFIVPSFFLLLLKEQSVTLSRCCVHLLFTIHPLFTIFSPLPPFLVSLIPFPYILHSPSFLFFYSLRFKLPTIALLPPNRVYVSFSLTKHRIPNQHSLIQLFISSLYSFLSIYLFSLHFRHIENPSFHSPIFNLFIHICSYTSFP